MYWFEDRIRAVRLYMKLGKRTGATNSAIGLGVRETDTLMILHAKNDGRDDVEFHFGSRASRMQGHSYFRMVVIEDSDHTFSDAACQQRVIATIQGSLEKMLLLKANIPLLPR